MAAFLSLDYLYVPTADVDAAVAHYVGVLGADLEWKVRAMGTVVAALHLAEPGPAVLLTDHLEGERPILIYRVADYAATVARLRAAGVGDLRELEIPPGPCASFTAVGGQRLAVYQLVRPDAASSFAGRIDA